jgi:hypothetical protein
VASARALLPVTLNGGMHQLADFGPILGDIRWDSSIGLVEWLDGDPHFNFLDALAAEVSPPEKRLAPVPFTHLILPIAESAANQNVPQGTRTNPQRAAIS